MKVYLLIEYDGLWEDYHEYIVGCYASYQMAIDELSTLEEEDRRMLEQKVKCQSCPVLYGALKGETNPDCSMCQMRLNSIDMDYYCENANDLYEDKYYKIKELEVIEAE